MTESTQRTYSNEKEFSTSKYLFGLDYLKGHQKIGEHSFPKVNPTREDYSKLVSTLKELGLRF
jgi:hypothetical protein